MKGERIFALTAVSLLLTLSIISTVQVQAVDHHTTTLIKEKIDEFKTSLPSLDNNHQGIIERMKTFMNREEASNRFSEIKQSLLSGLNDKWLSGLESNFTSLDLIGMLFGSLMFLLMTQPIFLQFLVETQNQFLFVVILISLLFIEVFQKFFALKVVGVWDPYIKDDIDGIWNFFTIVFFTSYVKIYLSYLPTFIIQYSDVFTKVFFYALMFAIPILFNVCIADSIDMIDWNGDEWPVPPLFS
jgi:hypothetical protein